MLAVASRNRQVRQRRDARAARLGQADDHLDLAVGPWKRRSRWPRKAKPTVSATLARADTRGGARVGVDHDPDLLAALQRGPPDLLDVLEAPQPRPRPRCASSSRNSGSSPCRATAPCAACAAVTAPAVAVADLELDAGDRRQPVVEAAARRRLTRLSGWPAPRAGRRGSGHESCARCTRSRRCRSPVPRLRLKTQSSTVLT